MRNLIVLLIVFMSICYQLCLTTVRTDDVAGVVWEWPAKDDNETAKSDANEIAKFGRDLRSLATTRKKRVFIPEWGKFLRWLKEIHRLRRDDVNPSSLATTRKKRIFASEWGKLLRWLKERHRLRRDDVNPSSLATTRKKRIFASEWEKLLRWLKERHRLRRDDVNQSSLATTRKKRIFGPLWEKLMRWFKEKHRIRRDDVNPSQFLERFGYLPKARPGVSFDSATKTSAIKQFQKMYQLDETGRLDDKTIEAMTLPRCGVPDVVKNKKISKRYYAPGFKWQKKQLKWKLLNFWNSPNLPSDTQRRAIYDAFNLWSQVVPLDFEETTGKADFNLRFASGEHGDGSQNSFDGPNGILAHAYFPESGELHYDASESWTDGVNSGINLKIVTAHELGHAIGLGHSNVGGSLMAPYYQGYEENFKLRDDDIQGAQSLYGGRSGNQPVPTTTTTKTAPGATTRVPVTPPRTTPTTASTPRRDPGSPDTCNLNVKAIAQTHDSRVYIYNGDKMWRASDYSLDPGFPTLISTSYELSPVDINAAVFSWKTYYTYFFKGSDVWVYYGFQLLLHKTILNAAYPSNPQAAFTQLDSGSILLLKDNYLYEFDESKYDLSDSFTPVPIQSIYPNLPPNFNTILRLVQNPYLYLFSGTQYYKYDPMAKKVMDGYPKPNKMWMGKTCGIPPFTPK